MNAKNITDSDGNVLIIGDGGSRKTDFLTRFPGIYVFDFDKGMAVARGRDVEYDTFKDTARIVKARNGDGKATAFDTVKPGEVQKAAGLYEYGTAWDAFYKKFISISELLDKRAPTAPKAIGFDSLTMMSFIALNKILKDTGHEMPHQGTWGAHHEYFKTIFSMATAWPIRFICTAHIKRDENQLMDTVEKLPLLAGQLAALIPVFFDEVWYTESAGGGKQVIRTQQTPQLRQAKSRLWNIKDGTDFTWEELGKLISLPKAA